MSVTWDPDLLALEAEHAADGWAVLRPADGPVPEMPAWLVDSPPLHDESVVCSCREGTGELRVAAPDVDGAAPQVGWAVPGVWPDAADSTPAATLPAPGPVVAQLLSLMTEVERCDPFSLPAGQALADCQALLGLRHRLRLHTLTRLADVQARGLHELVGAPSTTAWVGVASPDTDPGEVTLARHLRRLSHLQAAVQAGTVSLGAAEQVRKAVNKLRSHLDRPDGLLDGQPAEPVLSAMLGNVLTLVCREHLGLPDDHPLVLELDLRLGDIAGSAARGASQVERLERAFTLMAEHLPAGGCAARGVGAAALRGAAQHAGGGGRGG